MAVTNRNLIKKERCKQEAFGLWQIGYTAQSVAAALGISRGAVKRYIKECIAESPVLKIEEARRAALLRLEGLESEALSLYENAGTDRDRNAALKNVLEIQKQKADLLGLNRDDVESSAVNLFTKWVLAQVAAGQTSLPHPKLLETGAAS